MNYKSIFLSTVFIAGLASMAPVKAEFHAEVNDLVHNFLDKKIKGPEFIKQLEALCTQHNTLSDMQGIVKQVSAKLNQLGELGKLLAELKDILAKKIDDLGKNKIDAFAQKAQKEPLTVYFSYFC